MASQISGYIGKLNPGNGTEYSLGSTAYGVCSTAANTAAKTVDMTGFTLMTGATVFIKFTNTNSANNPTLNINNTGAKSLIKYGTESLNWQAGAVLCLTYDGTYWVGGSVTLQDLGLSNAMHFIGKATVNITDGGTENPTITGYDFTNDRRPGDVVIGLLDGREYVWTIEGQWELLGQDASTTVDSGASTTNTWISRIQQNSDRTITVETGSLDTSGIWSGKLSKTFKIKLNNTQYIYDGSANVDLSTIYAPTAGGTANTQALVGNGATATPKWVNISPSISITPGTDSATPKVNVTVLGQSGTTAQAITTATTGVYGATKLTDAYTSTDATLAATGKSILAAIQTLDVSAQAGAASKTLTSIAETDGKITGVTYSDIAIAASQITSGTLGTARGGTGNSSFTASRLIYSESATKLSSSGHYANSTKIAVNSTSEPSYNLYVNGTSYFGGNTVIKGHVTPDADSTYTIGSTSKHWYQGYFDTIYVSSDTNYTASTSAYNGMTLSGAGWIDLTTADTSTLPHIDFKLAKSALDYQVRLDSNSPGRIRVTRDTTNVTTSASAPNKAADLTYNSRGIDPVFHVVGKTYVNGDAETSGYFLNNVGAAVGGYYVYGNNNQYGRLWIDTIGKAGTATTYTNPSNSSQTKTGYTGNVTGKTILTLGNDKAVGSNGSDYDHPGSAGNANNAQGYLRIYNSGSGYSETTSYGSWLYPSTGLAIPSNKLGIMFRPDSSNYYTHFSYETSGNEALVAATQNSVTSFIFVNGESYANVASNRWTKLTGASGQGNAPGLQIKQNCVRIGGLWGSGTNADYRLRVDNGSIFVTRAGECGVEIDNTQTTNPHKGLFGVGSSGNLGIYDRTKSKWVVYSDPSGNVVLNGNANTATKLATARSINGTNFDGSANITTANWGTARTLTIGSKGKSVNGSANVSWSLAEIGATVSNAWTAGTTAGPTIKTTVNGVTGTAVAVPTATASASGVVTTGEQTFGGKKIFNTEATFSAANQFRLIQGKYGVIFRNDGSNFFILMTASGSAASGSWTSARPLTIANSTGVCSINGNAATASQIYSSASTSKAYVLGTTTASSANHATVYNASVYTSGSVLYGAAWNDYAEFRQTKKEIEPGRCIREIGDDTLEITTKRLERGCEIVSDTYGFAIGETETCQTPIASSGRVLAYPYESREEFASHIGWPVCSGPNGTVSIMTEEEEEKYPSRIIGTISAVPDYEEWGTGNVKVNGRVWIRIR